MTGGKFKTGDKICKMTEYDISYTFTILSVNRTYTSDKIEVQLKTSDAYGNEYTEIRTLPLKTEVYGEFFMWERKHGGSMLIEAEDNEEYTPSATRGDYSPSCPWNAPGMSIHDFI